MKTKIYFFLLLFHNKLAMSSCSTAYTPIVTYNQPPFGFHEVLTPTDYKRCNEDPYIGTEQLKDELNERFHLVEKLKKQREQKELAELCAPVAIEGFRGSNNSFIWKILIVVCAAYILVKLTKKK